MDPVIRHKPATDASWMLRYRFESRAALDRHLRHGDGFYVPAPDLPGVHGSRVVVELLLEGDADAALLHGFVGSRSHDGVRLSMPSVRAASRWSPGPDSPRRQHRRMACDLLVEVQTTHGAPWLCRALDISEGGVRLSSGAFEAGVAGDDISLALLPPEPYAPPIDLRARLCWSGARDAGLAFWNAPRDLVLLLRGLEERALPVREVTHSAACPCTR
jgi:hypothetical protein